LALAPGGVGARGAWAAAGARPTAMKLWGRQLGFLGGGEGMASVELRQAKE
jgi:hypothetical protein